MSNEETKEYIKFPRSHDILNDIGVTFEQIDMFVESVEKHLNMGLAIQDMLEVIYNDARNNDKAQRLLIGLIYTSLTLMISARRNFEENKSSMNIPEPIQSIIKGLEDKGHNIIVNEIDKNLGLIEIKKEKVSNNSISNKSNSHKCETCSEKDDCKILKKQTLKEKGKKQIH